MPNDQGNFGALFGVVLTVVIVSIVVGLIVRAVNAAKVIQAGRNPLTLQTDIELQLLASKALAPDDTAPAQPERTGPGGLTATESKLLTLHDLHSRNLISDEELAAARAKILAE